MWYYNKWTPRLFHRKYDGGKESGVIGYFLIEWKKVFSIGLLRFNEGSRENYHSHAFNAITWWLSGKVREETWNGDNKDFSRSINPKITKRDKIHKVFAYKKTWAITFRGPWKDSWFEIDKNNNKITMTHRRRVLIKEYKNHIKDYGFISDLFEDTVYGIEKSKIEKYKNITCEFIEDKGLPKHIVNIPNVPYKEIACGTLKIYGEIK